VTSSNNGASENIPLYSKLRTINSIPKILIST
jgi:hypothetical protein